MYSSVMAHQMKFSNVLTTEKAVAFNRAFDQPIQEEQETAAPKIVVNIIDALARTEKDWLGVEMPYVEYLIKCSISADKIKICGKRFSELSELNYALMERRMVDPSKVPPFPDKNNLHQNWWKGTDKDPKSDFVQQRKLALDKWLNVLFEVYPELPYQPFVTSFFELEELNVEAALETSMKAERYNRTQAALTASPPAEESNQSQAQQEQYHQQQYHQQQQQQQQQQLPPAPPSRSAPNPHLPNSAMNWTAPNVSFDSQQNQQQWQQRQQQQQQQQQQSLFDV